MKNKGRFLIISVFALGLLIGCESKGFKAERDMWHAHKLAEVIYKNPKGTPSFQLTRAQDAYRAIIKKYPESTFAVQSKFSIGHLYLVKGEFQKAREEYKKLTLDCGKKGNICAEGYFAIGNSYELEGKWDEALSNYRLIMRAYPFSAKSLDLPIYIIRHYRRAGNEKNLASFADEAVSYYYGLKSKAETPKGGYILQSYITRSYIEAGKWQDALDNIDKIIRDYPKDNPQEARLIKAMIYLNRLGDKAKCKEELEKIIQESPQSGLAKQAKDVLKKL